MDARALIESLQSRGLSISLAGDKVRVEGSKEPDEETKGLVDELFGHKEEIKTLLAATTPGLTPDHIANIFFTEDERLGWLVLKIKQPAKLPQAPIVADSGITIVDVARFTEATIQDLVSYVSARNRGSGQHWVDSVLDEKLEQLECCGVKAEIRTIQ